MPELQDDPTSTNSCRSCGTTYMSVVGTFQVDWKCSVCGAPICRLCWRKGKRDCGDHPAEEAPPAAEATAPRPLPAGAISRAEAKEREHAFIGRLQKNITALYGIFSPLDHRWFDADEKNRDIHVMEPGQEALRRAVNQFVTRGHRKVFEETPTNRTLLCEVFTRELLGGRTPRVVVLGLAVNPIDDLVRDGGAARRLSYQDLVDAMTPWVHHPNVFYYIAAFATTGWSDEAKQMAANTGNTLVCLLDYRDGGWLLSPAPDSRWGDSLRMFDLNSPEEVVGRVAAFVEQHAFELLMDQVTDRFVASALGIDVSLVRKAFEGIPEKNKFVRLLSGGGDYRLVRDYGHGPEPQEV